MTTEKHKELREFAKAAMQGLLARCERPTVPIENLAISYAMSLQAELDKIEPECAHVYPTKRIFTYYSDIPDKDGQKGDVSIYVCLDCKRVIDD